MLKAHSRLFEHAMLAADLVLVAACWLAAYGLRFYVVGPPLVTSSPPPLHDYLLQLAPILVVWGVAFHVFGLYRPRRLGSYVSEWVDIAKASTLGVLVLVAVMTFVFHGYDYSRVVIVYFWILSIVAASFARGVFREGLRVARRHGYNLRHAVVVGGGEPVGEVLAMLRRRPDVGIQVLGLVGDKEERGRPGVEWLGVFEDLRAVLSRLSVDIVFVALPHAESARLSDILEQIGDEPVTIHFVPDIVGLASLRGGIEEFDGVPLIHLRESPLYGWNRVLKRAFDLGIGASALLLTAPVMLLVAVLVKLTSPGPVLFRQERMGLDGRRFAMLKFRTMRVDAEAETGPVWAQPGDPRRTAVGAFLRRWSLDELPQLFNVVFKGNLSLVGPRPHALQAKAADRLYNDVVDGYFARHRVKPGITGWAQVNGWRGETDTQEKIQQRVEHDLYYIENWSVLLDLYIVARTPFALLKTENAY